MAEVISRSQCPECAAKGKDNGETHLGMFEDGNQSCIVCKHFIPAEGSTTQRKEVPTVAGDLLQGGTYEAIQSRKLTKDTCVKYGIKRQNGATIFELRNADGQVVCQKLKADNGARDCKGKQGEAVLFGRHLFQPKEGQRNRIIVTEGELDAPSVYQTISNKSAWPVVSIIGGAAADDDATKVVNEIKKNFEYLNSWDEIVFCFDNDHAGRVSTDAIVAMFPGKSYVTKLTLNDPSDYLQSNRSQDLYKEVWASPQWKPESVVRIQDVEKEWSLGSVTPYISNNMTTKMLGRKLSTATLMGSGTGSGKSTVVRGQTLVDLENGVTVGAIFLEESPVVTQWELAGLHLHKPVRKIMYSRELLKINPDLVFDVVDDLEDDELKEAMAYIDTLPLVLCRLDEGAKPDEILSTIEYMVVGMGCKEIILDHITRVRVTNNKELDEFVDKLIALVERLPFHLTAISQLNQGESSTTHEEGKRTTLKDFRGSQVRVSLFHEIIAFNRNQQADCVVERNTIEMYSLKSRISNYTGYLESMVYDERTGRLAVRDGTAAFVDNTKPAAKPQPNFNVENMT